MRSSGLLVVLLLGACHRAAPPPPGSLAQSVFLGQAYTSGRVYLRAFGDDGTAGFPAEVRVTDLYSTDAFGEPHTLGKTGLLNGPGETHTSLGFPREEWPEVEGAIRNPPDFFSTVFDMELDDANIGVYGPDGALSANVPVLAWRPELAQVAIDRGQAGQPRPLTEAEAREVAAQKQGVQERDAELGCTTVPQFLDAAVLILSAKVGDAALRLSSYADAGCAGHLSQTYVLDVLSGDQEPRRETLVHYEGAI